MPPRDPGPGIRPYEGPPIIEMSLLIAIFFLVGAAAWRIIEKIA